MKCYADFDEFMSWNNTAMQWLAIELTVFFTFLFTMLIMLIKSRFFRIGADNSKMFESRYMSYLANTMTEAFI